MPILNSSKFLQHGIARFRCIETYKNMSRHRKHYHILEHSLSEYWNFFDRSTAI